MTVVVVANSAERAMPKRTSLPSMLPPGFTSVDFASTPSPVILGFGCDSEAYVLKTRTTSMAIIAVRTAQP